MYPVTKFPSNGPWNKGKLIGQKARFDIWGSKSMTPWKWPSRLKSEKRDRERGRFSTNSGQTQLCCNITSNDDEYG